jgi:alpha-beta hydrolase superfamily lysophospholipase
MENGPIRFRDWTSPVAPHAREVLSQAHDDAKSVNILFVPGGKNAQAFAEHWMPHAAKRGYSVHALTPRPGNDLRAHVHDVVQVAASLPRRTVLVGHGSGALVVAYAMGRYPAKAGVLLAPVVDGWRSYLDRRRRLDRTPRPVGDPPVLVAGSPDDKVVPRPSLDRVAARYDAAPLLFPGMGHDLMVDTNWSEPIEAVLDWLEKESVVR